MICLHRLNPMPELDVLVVIRHPRGRGPAAERAGPVLPPVRTRAGALPAGQDQHSGGGQTDLCLPPSGGHNALVPLPGSGR